MNIASGFSEGMESLVVGNVDVEGITVLDSSRQRTVIWPGQQTIPSSLGANFSQSVSNLKVSIIEQQNDAEGRIRTFYTASGTFFNLTEDDKTNRRCTWHIRFQDAAGTVIDEYMFSLAHNFCSYNGETAFSTDLTESAFNFFDIIEGATSQGRRPGGYEGGC